MPILNYTTKIDSQKTIMEIQNILIKRGAKKIVIDYENGLPVAVTFGLPHELILIPYALPCNYGGVLSAMQKDKNIPRSFINEEQALRTSWRIVKDWVEAQMALVEANLAQVREVFLPYAITKTGQTLFEYTSTEGMKLLGEVR